MVNATDPFQIPPHAKALLSHDAALRERVRELERRQAWIGAVGPPNHPDDERQWVLAYLDAKQQLATLTTAHQQAVTERDAAIDAQNNALDIATVINDPRVARLQADLQQAVEALAGVTTERDRLRDVKWSGITDLENRVIALEAALKYIAEYWNGNYNERAMTDYCNMARDTAAHALAALHGNGGQ